jgi:hypothetical protein
MMAPRITDGCAGRVAEVDIDRGAIGVCDRFLKYQRHLFILLSPASSTEIPIRYNHAH